MPLIRIENLEKRFDKTAALGGVSLTIEDGELFFLLGPSGCGKTTLLRLIAGLEQPTAGKIFFGEREMQAVPPHQRAVGMVFQQYALWPHLNIFENIAFGLRERHVERSEIRRRVEEAAALVHLPHLLQRTPAQLSGGEQQRVALARALAIRPEVILLDEPLSNLDARLRIEMRRLIRQIHRDLKTTAIYVTHDQEEALTLADRMAVLEAGKIMQTGTPQELYRSPGSPFIAEFLCEANRFEATVTDPTRGSLDCCFGTLTNQALPAGVIAGERLLAMIRPEGLLLQPASEMPTAKMLITETTFAGKTQELQGRIGEQSFHLRSHQPFETLPSVGSTQEVGLCTDDLCLFRP